MEAALMLGAWVELSLTCVKFPPKVPEVCQKSHDTETDCDRRLLHDAACPLAPAGLCPSLWVEVTENTVV